MIEVKDVNKQFGKKNVLKNISVSFARGQTNLLIGASGTGKSVLLKTMVGLVTPNSGDIFYDGRSFYNASRSLKKEIRREIGMMFQGAALFDSKNIQENVQFPLDILTNMSKEEKLERVDFALKRVYLENVNQKMPSEISGGMKKRVGIARAIVNNPSYLFCDEPNSGLDPLTATKIDILIQEITEEFNITTMIVTHDMNSVIEIGKNVVFLFEGEKIWEGAEENILHTDNEVLNRFVFANKLMKSLKK